LILGFVRRCIPICPTEDLSARALI